MAPVITVVGSSNLDLTAVLDRLPAPGDTVAARRLVRSPGGKGANQALAARRLGAEVRFVGAVGDDGLGDEALSLLRAEGVDLSGVRTVPGPTGLALIEVDAAGETTIVVVAGANAAVEVTPDQLTDADAVLTVLEIPDHTVRAVAAAPGFVAVNAAPARPLPADLLRRTDLLVVNRAEYAAQPHADAARAVAVTHGAAGAVLRRDGREVATATPPEVSAVDGAGAGDAFTAALLVALLEGRPDAEALHLACAAGALTATRIGAATSPSRAELDTLLAR